MNRPMVPSGCPSERGAHFLFAEGLFPQGSRAGKRRDVAVGCPGVLRKQPFCKGDNCEGTHASWACTHSITT